MCRDMLKRPIFIGSEIYRGSSYGAHHPLRVPRVSTVMDLSRALGWLPAAQFVASPRARPLALQQFHTPDYISALARAEARQSVSEADRARYHLGTPSNPVFAQMFQRPATGAGGVILAGELLAKGGMVYVPGGGTHHGMPDRANGFCYLNDPVLAIKSLQHHGAPRVLYVDVDAHHPDGVEVAFSGDTAVRMISVHEQGRWPRTGALDERAGGSAFNLPVPQELNDSEMAVILDEMILPLAEDFAPDAVVLQCGADALDEDPQSRLSLSNGALWSVVAALRAIAPRYLVLGGGGYNPWSVGRCWTGVWGLLNECSMPEVFPAGAQEVLRKLQFEGNSRGRNPPNHWFDTLRDMPRAGLIRDEIRARIDLLRARI